MRTTASGIAYRLDGDPSLPTLALVMGYTGSSRSWTRRFLDALRPHYRLLLVDNRGTGLSAKPREATAYTVGAMAQDLLDVAADASLSRMHVLGYSLGGCIGLELALTAPHLVASLTMVASTAGGTMYVPPADRSLLANLVDPPGRFIMEKVLATWRLLLSDGAVRKYELELLANLAEQLDTLTPRYVFAGHMHAYQNFDRSADLGRLSVPLTLVHGAQDRLTPTANSDAVHRASPGSRLVLLEECEHMPHVEATEAYVSAIRAATGHVDGGG